MQSAAQTDNACIIAPMNHPNLADLRKDYQKGQLLEQNTPAQPQALFVEWMQDALAANLPEPTAFSLATVYDNRPSCRIVLLKDTADGVFTFYTNYQSRKGTELELNPLAAATFFWPGLERQVRVEGRVRRSARAKSEAYFNSRPLESRISAAVSPQSQPVESRQALESAWQAGIDALGGAAPALPDNWGGFEIVPERIEFWQGGSGRLHDRIVYMLEADGTWAKVRLAP